MNSGQTILVIGAFVILSTMTLNVNATMVNSSTTGLEMEATLDAVSIAQTMMDEILAQDFDQHTAGGVRVFSYSDLTPTINLGPDGSSETIVGDYGVDTSSTEDFESKLKFNDVDDYNGYTRKSWNTRLGWFTVTVHVDYANEDNPDLGMTDQTFCKRASLTVSHPNLVKDFKNNVIPLAIQGVAVYRRYF